MNMSMNTNMNTMLNPAACRPLLQRGLTVLSLSGLLTLAACGGGGGGAGVQADPQRIDVAAVSDLPVGGSLTLSATATSGLSVSYTSTTPEVCAVSDAGVVTALSRGPCEVAIRQSGNSQYAPAAVQTVRLQVTVDPVQRLSFAEAPPLTLGGTATVQATATSGLPVRYSSLTPGVCSVSDSGQVTGLAVGTCLVAADQAGDSDFLAAPQVTQSLTVAASCTPAVPGAPTGVTARLDATGSAVLLSVGGVDGGCSAISGYTVRSTPARVNVTVSSLSGAVSCAGDCGGLAFTVSATNATGEGPASALTEVLTPMQVQMTVYEPDTQPNDSIFLGSFTYNSTTHAVTGLRGRLSESMTGGSRGYPNDSMTWLTLEHQLASWHDDTLGGTFVATFLKPVTTTFQQLLTDADGNVTGSQSGWLPGFGVQAGGIYAGYPAAYTNTARSVQNAYALVFVPDRPLQALSQAQLDKLSYADCAPGGMMGAVCMTGTSIAGYGAVGTMGGVPRSQEITVARP
ncbi:MAG: hypothetical protein RI907_3729 [Pseudomonadota bacterium]|jgi:hypothetical protein